MNLPPSKLKTLSPGDRAALEEFSSFLQAVGSGPRLHDKERLRAWIAEDPAGHAAYLGLTVEQARALGWPL